jgi:hypothetical protein
MVICYLSLILPQGPQTNILMEKQESELFACMNSSPIPLLCPARELGAQQVKGEAGAPREATPLPLAPSSGVALSQMASFAVQQRQRQLLEITYHSVRKQCEALPPYTFLGEPLSVTVSDVRTHRPAMAPPLPSLLSF